MSFIRGTIFPSITNQAPSPYFTLDDKFPQYVQVQRTQATIQGTSVKFSVNTFDPNAFIRSKAYIKLQVRIEKQERNPVGGAVIASNYIASDRIYKKAGLVLQNSCTDCTLRLNSHTMNYKDLRYITSKLDRSFAGKSIINNYLSTTGGQLEELNGVYNETGDIMSNKQNGAAITPATTLNLAPPQQGFNVGAGLNTIAFVQATGILTFAAGGGVAPDLLNDQIFIQGDRMTLVSGEIFVVIGTQSDTEVLVTRVDATGNMAAQDLVLADVFERELQGSYQGDDGREISYSEAFRDLNLGQTTSTFNYTEPLNFGPFNALADYGVGEIYKGAWNLRQSPLIPFVRELELNMDFRDIAANSLIYAYGRSNTGGNDRECQLRDIQIVSAELILIWVKPRDEVLLNMPNRVRIQSWMYDHRQFDLGTVNNGANVVSSENNIYTQQVPSYLLYYGMVDKDGPSYLCRAVNTDSDGLGGDQQVSVDVNSVETGMFPLAVGTGASFILRSNTLGGDDILDQRYNAKELYRLTLKNSMSNFPYSETKFRGLQVVNNMVATYPSQFYILLGEQELNSFFIRKGQLQVSNVMDYNSTLVALDGYSIPKIIGPNTFDGGNKDYRLHIFYIYDRFYIELDNDGFVDSKFDSAFF